MDIRDIFEGILMVIMMMPVLEIMLLGKASIMRWMGRVCRWTIRMIIDIGLQTVRGIWRT